MVWFTDANMVHANSLWDSIRRSSSNKSQQCSKGDKLPKSTLAPVNQVVASHTAKQKCHNVQTDGCCPWLFPLRPEIAGDPCVSCFTPLSTAGGAGLKIDHRSLCYAPFWCYLSSSVKSQEQLWLWRYSISKCTTHWDQNSIQAMSN